MIERCSFVYRLPIDSDELTPGRPECYWVVICRLKSRAFRIHSGNVGKVVLDPILFDILDQLATSLFRDGELMSRFVINQLGESSVLDTIGVDEELGEFGAE